jgi:integrase
MLDVKENDIQAKLSQYEAGLFYADSTKKLYRNIARRLLDNPKSVIDNLKSKSRWLQVRTVVNRLNELGLTNINLPPWQKREPARAEHIRKRIVDEKLFEVILDEIPESTNGEQLRLAALLSYSAGLKLEEVLNLRSKDVKIGKRIEIAVVGGRTESRTAIVAPKEAEMKQEIQNRLNKFVSFTITADYIRITLNRIARNLEISFSFQDFRHAFAIRLHEEGVPIMGIKNLLGHKDRKTTMVYLDISPQETFEILEKLGY